VQVVEFVQAVQDGVAFMWPAKRDSRWGGCWAQSCWRAFGVPEIPEETREAGSTRAP
jgi:hypothetical protein